MVHLSIVDSSNRITVELVRQALAEHCKCTVSVVENLPTASEMKEKPSDVFVKESKQNYEELYAAQSKKLAELEYNYTKSLASIQTFHRQQQNLFDEFVLLRGKYDEQKNALVANLWTHCGAYHPDLRHIPNCQEYCVVDEDPDNDSSMFIENETRIGKYAVGDMLGEGQFATVRGCWRKYKNAYNSELAPEAKDAKLLALKIIEKDRITSFSMLKRVSNELYALRSLKSPYIVKISDVIQTDTKLFIITEKGGDHDLFEFFDAHPEGVSEAWARNILYFIMKAIVYIHDCHICHRDLKPENVLISFNVETGTCNELKLCDFGLSTICSNSHKSNTIMLTDFCGSPGFFAPEMILPLSYLPHAKGFKGDDAVSYRGDKADIWSVGCILLELLMGHELFCECWMEAYDYNNLQNKEIFADVIQTSVVSLQSELANIRESGNPEGNHFSPECIDFIVTILNLNPNKRPTSRHCVKEHDWLKSVYDNDVTLGGGLCTQKTIDDYHRVSTGDRPQSGSRSRGREGESVSIKKTPVKTVESLDENEEEVTKAELQRILKNKYASSKQQASEGHSRLRDYDPRMEMHMVDDMVGAEALDLVTDASEDVKALTMQNQKPGAEIEISEKERRLYSTRSGASPLCSTKGAAFSSPQATTANSNATHMLGSQTAPTVMSKSEPSPPSQLNLPPINPSTPNVLEARKILRKGDSIVNQASSGDWRSPVPSPNQSTHDLDVQHPSRPRGKTSSLVDSNE